jgi:hypothetical protein
MDRLKAAAESATERASTEISMTRFATILLLTALEMWEKDEFKLTLKANPRKIISLTSTKD